MIFDQLVGCHCDGNDHGIESLTWETELHGVLWKFELVPLLVTSDLDVGGATNQLEPCGTGVAPLARSGAALTSI